VEPREPPATPFALFLRALARPGWKLILAFWIVVVIGLFITRRIF
jgi:hypothetical protein